MAEKTIDQLILEITWYDIVAKVKAIFTKINSTKLTASKATTITALGVTSDLTAISATFADLAASRTAVNTLKTETETRLDTIEAKIDSLIAKLKMAGLVATS